MTIKMKDLNKVMKQNKGKVIGIYFYQSRCAPCKTLTPVYESLANQHDTIVLLKMDGLGDLGRKFGADGYPTFVFLKNGKFLFSFDRGKEDTLRQVCSIVSSFRKAVFFNIYMNCLSPLHMKVDFNLPNQKQVGRTKVQVFSAYSTEHCGLWFYPDDRLRFIFRYIENVTNDPHDSVTFVGQMNQSRKTKRIFTGKPSMKTLRKGLNGQVTFRFYQQKLVYHDIRKSLR
ncbi:thioredoxin-1 [Clonorchis sinensis]|uniref:Thioredoxin-1 n=1 Tax=Clonorchis sinensis TaxID=79923 RepID=G7Y4X6_CLOSI|nr:thioredoxin-1 [Clonorchis sinensis]